MERGARPDARWEGENEYVAALGALDFGAGFFVDRFAELVPSLPVHAAGHPPGLLLTMHALGIDSPAARRRCHRRRRAQRPARLPARPPGARRPAGAAGGAAAGAGAGRAAVRRDVGRRGLPHPRPARRLAARRPRLAGARRRRVLLAAASFFAWSLLAVGAWAAILTLRRDGLAGGARALALCGAALLAFYALLYAATGFDPIGTIRSTEEVYRAGVASIRPYWFWLFGSPAAFLLVLGLPLSWLALRALAAGETLAIAIFAVIATAAVLGFTKAETERIWLFLAPFVCLAAAAATSERTPLRPLLAALAAQAVLYEVAWDTVW